MKAAGILFYTPDLKVLFLQRADDGTWAYPGGHIESGETPAAAAIREAKEEVGIDVPAASLVLWGQRSVPVDFTAYACRVQGEFLPILNAEHTGFMWAPATAPPAPLHPGVEEDLARFAMDETQIAEAVRDGRFPSPQRLGAVWMFALRITGTGVAFRSKLDEYAFRDPNLYLSDEFLKRCNGLPVVWEHPPGETLTSTEFGKRVIGAICLPYIKGDEVWGIARIYDDEAAKLMASEQLSTSPGVSWRDPGANEKVQAEDGKKMLIEAKPTMLDHLAICEVGVWDKGGGPAGVQPTAENGRTPVVRGESVATAIGDSNMAKENESEAAAATDRRSDEHLDKLLSAVDAAVGKLDALGKRMDEIEAREKEGREDACRKDAEAREKESREDAGRKDETEARAKEKEEDDAQPSGSRKELDVARKRYEAAESPGEKRKWADIVKKLSQTDAAGGEFDPEKTDPEATAADRKRKDDNDSDRQDSALTRRLADLESRVRDLTDEDYAALSDAQSRADSVARAYGETTPRPMQGESVMGYRRRLAARYQPKSKQYAGVNLRSVTDPSLFGIVEAAIYTDALTAANAAADLPMNRLREVTSKSAAGHTIVEFRGQTAAWMRRGGSLRARLNLSNARS